jgi:hypothetical protein
MHGDTLRALAGPSRRVGTYQTQIVGKNNWMGEIEEINIGLPISPCLYNPRLSARAIPPAPILIPATSFLSLIRCLIFILDPHHYAFIFLFSFSCSTHTHTICL